MPLPPLPPLPWTLREYAELKFRYWLDGVFGWILRRLGR